MRRTILIALALLPGCAGAREYRPGAYHAGWRAYVYRHTPIDPRPSRYKFEERPPTGRPGRWR